MASFRGGFLHSKSLCIEALGSPGLHFYHFQVQQKESLSFSQVPESDCPETILLP